MSSRVFSFIFGGIILFCSGCSLFQPLPDHTRLFHINFQAPNEMISAINQASMRISIEHFPEYLDRPFLVTKIGAHELKENPRYRWATSLPESILHMISSSIRHNFSKMIVYEFPRELPSKVDFSLKLEIERLEVDEKANQVIFAGVWEFQNLKSNSISRSDFEFYEPLSLVGDRYAEIVARIEKVILNLGKAVVRQMDLLLLKNEAIISAVEL